MKPLSFYPILFLLALVLLVAGCAVPQVAPGAAVPTAAESEIAEPEAQEDIAAETALIPVRFGSIAGASQSYIPLLLRDEGIGEKYGFDVEIVSLTSTGQQWTGLRTGDFDIASGSVLDLLRQRQAGLEAKAVRGFYTFSNPVIAPAEKPYETLADLAGARVGTPSTALLDWMIIRAAGKRAYDFDIEKEAEVSNAAPPLINELIKRGELDAALQFSDFTLEPIHEGTLKAVTTVPDLLAEAGFDPDSFYLLYTLSKQWRAEHPEAVAPLIAAMDEAVELMMTDDEIWPELAAYSGLEDMALLPAFIEQQRKSFKTTFTPEKIEPTQELLDALVEVIGEEPIGVTEVDPEAFDFEANQAAKELRTNAFAFSARY